ncbi:MAG: hypothetical protein ACXADY_25455 [Candidatus Hodarchaeales archaeon]
MFQLYFKHLLTWAPEWQESPFAPWMFEESVFLSILSFFESGLLDRDDFSLREILQCESIFMDSGAFAAATMGFTLDPYEVAEMQALLKADLIVPLDRIVMTEDSPEVVNQKIQETLRNTEIMLDYCPKGSEVVAPLQGLTSDLITQMFDAYRELGLKRFGLGGLVFQPTLTQTIERVKVVRAITQGYWLHLFGKFLHPYLLKPVIEAKADSVDGFGFILSSNKGLYIDIEIKKYISIGLLSDSQLKNCPCAVCHENDLLDFQRGDREGQHLLIQHNIHTLITLKDHYLKTLPKT